MDFTSSPGQRLVRGAAHLRQIAQLTDADIARATGSDRDTARAWLEQTCSLTGDRAQRPTEFVVIVERLMGVLKPALIAPWLRTPSPMLAAAPIDLIARGEHQRVAALVSALEEAPFV